MTTRQLKATSPAATPAAPEPQPKRKPRVRHIVTGDVGVLDHIQPDTWFRWARVRWEPRPGNLAESGQPPGMVRDGLAFVAPGLLVRLDTGRRLAQ